MLAVAYVLSYAAGPAGFVLLGIAAAVAAGLGGGLGPWSLALAAGSASCGLGCPAFRWCMRRWRPE